MLRLFVRILINREIVRIREDQRGALSYMAAQTLLFHGADIIDIEM